MSEQSDRLFFRNFSIIIVALMIFSALLIVLAHAFHGTLTPENNPVRDAIVADRIAPVGAVYAGSEGADALKAAQAAAQAAVAAAGPPFGGTLDGEVIYDNVCKACHGQGIAGAPALVASAWNDRLTKGMDALVSNAIQGYQGEAGVMPAKGGRTDLTDEQVRASVQFMVDRVQ